MNNRKIIFLDCDGTLFDVPRGMLFASDKSKYAISELIKKGHLVFIATGRCKCIVPDDIRKLNPSGFITQNGAYCFNDKEVIYQHNMDPFLVKSIIDYCDSHNGVYCLETPDYIYSKDLNDELLVDFVTTWGIGLKSFKIIDESYKCCQMIMNAFENDEECDKFYELFKDKLDVRKQYGFTSFDLSSKEISKGSAVKQILDYYHIDESDAYAFGDGLNDVEMLKSVTNSYCMANGNELLKKEARYIAPDVLNDGFYLTMVDLGLIDPIMKKM